MKNVEPMIFAVLLTCTLGVAWQGENDDAKPKMHEGEVTVLEFPQPSAVTGIEWSSAQNTTHLKVEGAEAGVWVTWNTKGEGEGTDEKVYHFPGNQLAHKVVSSFQPLMAERQFDGLSAEALDEMGLKDPTEAVSVVAGDTTHRYHLGGSAYGSDHFYLQSVAGGPVFLVPSKGLRPLRKAHQRLMERDPFSTDFKAVAGAQIQLSSGLVIDSKHQNHEDIKSAFWALASAPEKQDGRLQTFFDQLNRVRVEGYPERGAVPPTITPTLKVTFLGKRGEALGEGALGQVEVGTGLYVKTPSTRDWVPLTESGSVELLDTLVELEDR